MTHLINGKLKVCNGCFLMYRYCCIIMLFCYLPLSGCHPVPHVTNSSNAGNTSNTSNTSNAGNAGNATIVLENIQPGIEEIKTGETAFFQKNYTQAAAIFTRIAKENSNLRVNDIARYNLACTKLAMAENEQAFDEAMIWLNQWRSFEPSETASENPRLLIQVVQEIADLKKQTQLESQKKNLTLTATVKAQNKKILKLQELIKTLQFQISELENIDQELQEKRNAD